MRALRPAAAVSCDNWLLIHMTARKMDGRIKKNRKLLKVTEQNEKVEGEATGRVCTARMQVAAVSGNTT